MAELALSKREFFSRDMINHGKQNAKRESQLPPYRYQERHAHAWMYPLTIHQILDSDERSISTSAVRKAMWLMMKRRKVREIRVRLSPCWSSVQHDRKEEDEGEGLRGAVRRDAGSRYMQREREGEKGRKSNAYARWCVSEIDACVRLLPHCTRICPISWMYISCAPLLPVTHDLRDLTHDNSRDDLSSTFVTEGVLLNVSQRPRSWYWRPRAQKVSRSESVSGLRESANFYRV